MTYEEFINVPDGTELLITKCNLNDDGYSKITGTMWNPGMNHCDGKIITKNSSKESLKNDRVMLDGGGDWNYSLEWIRVYNETCNQFNKRCQYDTK